MVMEIIEIYSNQMVDIKQASIACIGFFDGVHKGHQELIHTTIKKAKEEGLLAACITFHKDPWHVLFPHKEISNITPPQKRLAYIEAFGIERCYLLHFDTNMANLSKEAFVSLLQTLQIKWIVAGDDFRFAKHNEGDITYLNTCIPTIVCETIMQDKQRIASSTIEKAIEEGNMQFASVCLGRDYTIEGEVVYGNQVGRKLGFPTANLKMKDHYIIPKLGVYAGFVHYEDCIYKALINVGHNPTLNYQRNISIEAFILDFHQDLYGKQIRIDFHEYLREEQKFHSKEELIMQLNKDVETLRSKKNETRII